MDNSSRDQRDGNLPGTADPTIVGGRPIGRGRSLQGIPRGIEVLIKKASVDPEFRALLLEKRVEAAAEIGLELSTAESAMLNALPGAQIEQIIGHTTVPVEHRRAFLGRVAAAMLAVVGLGLSGCRDDSVVFETDVPITFGIRPGEYRSPKRRRGLIHIKQWEFDDGPASLLFKRVTEERLKVEFSAQGQSELLVKVGYDCPFKRAELMVLFRNRDSRFLANIWRVPPLMDVSRGKGEATFWARGKKEVTDLIITMLVNAAEEAKYRFLTVRSWPKSAGEYVWEKTVVMKVVEHHKEWAI